MQQTKQKRFEWIVHFGILMVFWLFPLQKAEAVLSKPEKNLVNSIQKIRSNFGLFPFLFSGSLYEKAKNLSLELIQEGVTRDSETSTEKIPMLGDQELNLTEKDSKKDSAENSTIKEPKSFSLRVKGPNFEREFLESIRTEYRTILLDPEKKEMALAITQDPKTGLYYLVQVVQSVGEDAYDLEEKTFADFLAFVRSKKELQTRRSARLLLKEFMEKSDEPFWIEESARSISVFLSSNSELDWQFRWSFPSSDIIAGPYQVSIFSKSDPSKERERLKGIYTLPTVREWEYYEYFHDQSRDFWITEKEIVQFYDYGSSFSLQITQNSFPESEIQNKSDQLGLTYPITERLYYRLLKEYIRMSSELSITEFLRSTFVKFDFVQREILAILRVQKKELTFRYVYLNSGELQEKVQEKTYEKLR